MVNSIRSNFPRFLDKLNPSKTTVLLITAIIIGAGTGLGAVFFIKLIGLVEKIFFGYGVHTFGPSLGRWVFLLIPAIGGLLAGPIIAFIAPEAKGHGVPEVMQAIAVNGGRIRPVVVVAKLFASGFCIGTGGSAGREGPIVQVGAALGSTIGQWFHMSEGRIRNLVACGAAAGIAATFNAPIAGVVFSMEVILGEFQLNDLGNVIISAITASTVARIFLGSRPAFGIPLYSMKSPWEIFLYILLGIISGLVAVFFIKMLYWFEDVFDNWKFPDALKPMIGGLLLGAVAVAYPIVLGIRPLGIAEFVNQVANLKVPHIFGAGYSTIEASLLGSLTFGFLIAMLFLKLLATSLTLGSGNSGGVFAPALFSGATLGSAFGRIVHSFIPGLSSSIGAFATVGMAAVFAGAAHAPFTAIFIVFEMTDDYRLMIPLMAGVISSLLIARALNKDSIYTLKLTRRGIHIQHGRDIDVMQAVRVQEVMNTPSDPIPEDMSVDELGDKFLETGHHGFCVLDKEQKLFGVVSLEDYRRAINQKKPISDMKVRDIATKNPLVAFPDETVGEALRRMAPRDLSRLPVVARNDPKRLLGVVRRNDIIRAYELGVVRRYEARKKAELDGKISESGASFSEIQISKDSPAVDKNISELELPRNAVIVSVRRAGKIIIPRGDTQLKENDLVTILAESDALPKVQELFGHTTLYDTP